MDSLTPIAQAAMFMLKTRGKSAALGLIRQALASVEQDHRSGELSSAGYQRSKEALLAIEKELSSAPETLPKASKPSGRSKPSTPGSTPSSGKSTPKPT